MVEIVEVAPVRRARRVGVGTARRWRLQMTNFYNLSKLVDPV